MNRELDALDAEELLDTLDMLVEAIDQYVDEDGKPHPYLWDDYAKAYDKLRDYGRRKPRAF